MNNDLISREALKKLAIPCEIHNGALTDMCVPLYQIDNAPTVNLEKHSFIEGYKEGCEFGKKCYARPQGEWKYTHDTFSRRICNKCNYSQVIVDGMADNFCPSCGADMRKGDENNG